MSKACRSGRKVLITGATGGIGLAAARRFAENGDSLFLHGFQNRERIERLKEEFPGTEIETFFCDLGSPVSQDELAERAWRWSGSGIDVFVQAAGVDILTGSRKNWTYEEKLEALWKVDVQAGIRLARNISSRLVEAGRHGVILMIGWDAVEWGMSGDSAELFAAAKGAVTSFVRCLAQKTGPNVRVNCLAPGWIQTRWGQNAPEPWKEYARKDSLLNRWGTPEDMAEAMFFLASEEASFLNAVVLPVDGGKRF